VSSAGSARSGAEGQSSALRERQQPTNASPAEAASQYEQLRSRISAAGRTAYLGVSPDPKKAVQEVKDKQAGRALDTYTWIKSER
jgi:hypothetical protein